MLSSRLLRGLCGQQGVKSIQTVRCLMASQLNANKWDKNDTMLLRRITPTNKMVIAKTGDLPHDHSSAFKLERYWLGAMLPLFPAAYFVHNPVMDYALAVMIGMHVHWGLSGVIADYARPFVIGDVLSKAAKAFGYLFTAVFLSSLFNFNYNDVGITRAFEMIWAL